MRWRKLAQHKYIAHNNYQSIGWKLGQYLWEQEQDSVAVTEPPDADWISTARSAHELAADDSQSEFASTKSSDAHDDDARETIPPLNSRKECTLRTYTLSHTLRARQVDQERTYTLCVHA